jgi:hypothetical protein
MDPSAGINYIANTTQHSRLRWQLKLDLLVRFGGTSASCIATISASYNPLKAGDCDNSGTVTIAEVQSAINMFLGLKSVEACVDQDGGGGVSIAEVQKVINSFLGL